MQTLKHIIAASMLFLAVNANAQNTATTDEGVVINGVKWATRNVDMPGTFAETPESFGKLYQWNRNVAWDTADETPEGWDDSSIPEGNEWVAANDPSPAGWRVPTAAENKKLLDASKVTYEWITQNGVKGGKFTDKVTGASIFLPATGCIADFGTRFGIAVIGFYWSSTPAIVDEWNDVAQQINFNENFTDSFQVHARGAAQSLRPVADNSGSADIGETLLDGRVITAYYSLTGISLQDEPESGIYIVVYDNGKAEKMMK
jgi:hypothetical protein